MAKRVLGSTTLQISEIGFGGIPIQRTTKEETKDIISECLKRDINFIDTARGYTVSEEYIGEAISGIRNHFIIASKSMQRNGELIKKDVFKSLENLKTDHIDLYQLHGVKLNEFDQIFDENNAYEMLLKLKETGYINHIGITTHSLDVLKKAVHSNKFETIMFPYNIVEDQGEEVFEEANAKNIGIIVMKPLAGGNIENSNLALKYVLNNKNISTAIPGMGSLKEVTLNSEVMGLSYELSNEELNEILKIKSELGNKFCRRCGYCLPCTNGIDIPSNFLFRNYKLKYNLEKWAKDRYFSMGVRAKDCIECGKCELKCPYELPIINMLKEVKECFEDYN